MRVATLCVAACLVTSASVTSAEPKPPVEPAGMASTIALPQGSEAQSAPSPGRDASADAGSNSSAQPKSAAPSKAELCETAVLVAQANNLPALFFTRLIRQESGFNPRIVSSAGAQGIAQFMPGTASSRGLADPFEPTGALAASAKYLAELVSQFGNLGLAAAAYNAGPRRVQDWIAKRTKLPAETRNYVYSITGQLIQAWTGSRSRTEQVQLASAGDCSGIAHLEHHALIAQNDGPPVSQGSQATVRSHDQRAEAAASERHGLPRPSHFIVGRPVAAAIKAAEAKVLARAKWQPGTRHARHGVVRVASLR
jgi:hypothetical protein